MITCYLDSQDYSTLTDPKVLTNEKLQIREALLNFAREGTVKFVYSSTVICEAVPTSPEASRLAELKAELLSDLCGFNALVSFDRLATAETTALANGSGAPKSMLDPHGYWFPEIGTQALPESPWNYMLQQAESDLVAKGMSRQQNRATMRKMFKNGEPRGELKKYLENQSQEWLASEFLKQYPMKPEHAELMVKFSFGRATDEEFGKALKDSLRDPRWMMKWFATNYSMAGPISDLVRKPGQELGAHLRDLVDLSIRHASALSANNTDGNPTGKGGEVLRLWGKLQNSQLVHLIQHVANSEDISLRNYTPAEMQEYCPGMSSMIRSLYSSAWVNVTAARLEEPSDSQPVDAIHAIYAPYVQVFRADRFMAPHIQKQVQRHGTIVVSRLSKLIDVLNKEVQRDKQVTA
ncbi:MULTISPECIES: hypothetical protein [unclassified Janthinobacterium]|uniref:hypothetical protein n=1 Tax=unclassified Janthinobacterium TaxID=2610881 RepID=UPI001614743F|nr:MULTISPECIES: hypothetical protein [unclassified Janthinobacterium]MBB5369955.1 hypothetical protein [Janthinobacterium sp. K2C7]MBB5382761.1 hypothetical protein [Janthinobacterium sp. K2Li3]MBB5384746.1 hypothetical protein [Janthinobacterium sp. K2E3]